MSSPEWIDRVRKRLHDALPTIIRRTLKVMPPVGFLLLSLGVGGDILNWWDNLGYSSNVLAGMTAACFGIPLAIFVLHRYIETQGEQRQRMDLLRRLRRTVVAMHAALDRVASDRAEWAAYELSKLSFFVRRNHNLSDPVRDFDDVERFMAAQQHMLGVLDQVLRRTIASDAFGQAEWEFLRARWRFVHDSLMLEAETLDMQIASTDSTAKLVKSFEGPNFPVQFLSELKGLRFPRIDAVKTKQEIDNDDTGRAAELYSANVSSTTFVLDQAAREFIELDLVYGVIGQVLKDIVELEKEVRETRRGNMFADP